jgi:hypothetical protein
VASPEAGKAAPKRKLIVTIGGATNSTNSKWLSVTPTNRTVVAIITVRMGEIETIEVATIKTIDAMAIPTVATKATSAPSPTPATTDEITATAPNPEVVPDPKAVPNPVIAPRRDLAPCPNPAIATTVVVTRNTTDVITPIINILPRIAK